MRTGPAPPRVMGETRSNHFLVKRITGMTVGTHNSIDEIAPSQWNALRGADNPFLRHEFLAALEHTHCVGRRTGWQPQYITLSDEQGLAAAAPAYLKTHSYGEFVFDFTWAQAYAQLGQKYFPKLTIAVPFTPATGARLLVRPDLKHKRTATELITAIESFTRERGLSSSHALFIDEQDAKALSSSGWLLRQDCQFQWSNRGYESFEHYLATFTAEKRKKVRRERRRVAEAGIHFATYTGTQLQDDAELLHEIYTLHRDTFLRHGREPYLTPAFFKEIARTLARALIVKLALQRGTPVAAAIFFSSPSTLYGRYWGAAADYHSLHFETCYHQGIEYCIEHGLQKFEPGTQGEHKVSRGFEPTLTASAHYIADARFRAIIGHYLERERTAVKDYAAEVQLHVPYRA